MDEMVIGVRSVSFWSWFYRPSVVVILSYTNTIQRVNNGAVHIE